MTSRIPSAKAIAFDVFGTLYDVNSVLETAAKTIPNADAFVARWRAKQLEYSFLTTLMNRYENFWEITQRALTFTALSLNVNLDRRNRAALMDAWNNLKAYPEVADVLSSLRSKKKLAVLSNGNMAFLKTLLKNTNLQEAFDQILSAEEVSKYKPAPEVYNLAAKKLGVNLKDILMISSNSFDVIGSKAAGMKSCWVRRTQVPLDELGIRPDVEISDLKPLSK